MGFRAEALGLLQKCFQTRAQLLDYSGSPLKLLSSKGPKVPNLEPQVILHPKSLSQKTPTSYLTLQTVRESGTLSPGHVQNLHSAPQYPYKP